MLHVSSLGVHAVRCFAWWSDGPVQCLYLFLLARYCTWMKRLNSRKRRYTVYYTCVIGLKQQSTVFASFSIEFECVGPNVLKKTIVVRIFFFF